MRRSVFALVAAVAAGGLFAAIPDATGRGTEHQKTFQIVYHSDTRAYYRPCG